MRLVLDTNVVVAGLLWEGPPNRLIAQANLIVSGDRDLLELRKYQAIPIVTAAEALTHLPQR